MPLNLQSRAQSAGLDRLPTTEWSAAIDRSLLDGGVTADTMDTSTTRVLPSTSPDLEAVLVPVPSDDRGARVLVIERGKRNPHVATFDR